MKVILDHIDDNSSNIKSFYFIPEKKLDFQAGQYIQLSLPKERNAVVDGNRWYTLSSSPTEKLLTISTRFDSHISIFKTKLLELNPGTELVLSEPIGDFVLPIDKSVPLVFVCGGIGITPVRSMVKYLIDTDEKRSISLIYFAKSQKDLIFEDIFKSYDMNYLPVISSSPNVDILELLNQLNTALDKAYYFVSGPQPLVESFVDRISDKYGRSNVIMDYFPGYRSI